MWCRVALLMSFTTLFVCRQTVGVQADRSISPELLEHPKLETLNRGLTSAPSVFIAIGSAPKKHALRDAVRSTWLKACTKPTCSYRFFTDANVTLQDKFGGPKREDGVPSDTITTPAEESGYSNFGIRALQQMEWSLRNVDFDHYLRIDDDGMLCVDHLMHDLANLPLERLFWGKYWCQHMARMDENFMLMSRDVAFVLAEGWRTDLLPFRAPMSLDKLTANLQPMMNLDVVGDTDRLWWLGPVLQLPQQEEDASSQVQRQLRKRNRNKFNNNEAGNVCLGHYERQNTYNISAQELRWKKAEAAVTWAKCPDICHRFVWLHHLAPAEIVRLHNNSIPFDANSPHLLNPPSKEQRQAEPTQCRGWKGFPLFSTQKTSGHQVKRRQFIQNETCFWTWCTEQFGGQCCNAKHKRAMRSKIESLFTMYHDFENNA